MRWFAVSLQIGDLGIVQTLLAETNNQPAPALVEQLLGAIDVALASSACSAPKWRAIAFKLRGICLEAIAEVGQALTAYDQALALDPKVGVKRKADQLRKVVPNE
jgi:tetratricopeptide (TPR) repeat protein